MALAVSNTVMNWSGTSSRDMERHHGKAVSPLRVDAGDREKLGLFRAQRHVRGMMGVGVDTVTVREGGTVGNERVALAADAELMGALRGVTGEVEVQGLGFGLGSGRRRRIGAGTAREHIAHRQGRSGTEYRLVEGSPADAAFAAGALPCP